LQNKGKVEKPAEQKAEPTTEVKELLELNQENLLHVWTDLVEFFKSDTGILYAIGVKYKPLCSADNVIEFRVRERNECNVLLQQREYLLKHFLSRFDVSDLELEIVQDANANVDLLREYMSDEDLYEDIRKSNPSLRNWLDELGV